MQISTLLLVLALQLLALCVLANRLEWDWLKLLQDSQSYLSAGSALLFAAPSCGLLPAQSFTIASQRVVLGDELVPAASV